MKLEVIRNNSVLYTFDIQYQTVNDYFSNQKRQRITTIEFYNNEENLERIFSGDQLKITKDGKNIAFYDLKKVELIITRELLDDVKKLRITENID